MKTDAVMCMALTRHKPSRTPLWLTSSSTFGVMLMNPRRPGTSNQRCSVSDFIEHRGRSLFCRRDQIDDVNTVGHFYRREDILRCGYVATGRNVGTGHDDPFPRRKQARLNFRKRDRR